MVSHAFKLIINIKFKKGRCCLTVPGFAFSGGDGLERFSAERASDKSEKLLVMIVNLNIQVRISTSIIEIYTICTRRKI